MAAQFLGRLDSTVGISQLDLATCGACVVMGLVENIAAGFFAPSAFDYFGAIN